MVKPLRTDPVRPSQSWQSIRPRFWARGCCTTQDMRCRRREQKLSKQRKRHCWSCPLIRYPRIGETGTACDGPFSLLRRLWQLTAGSSDIVVPFWAAMSSVCSTPPPRMV
nr:hypothetical protein CFP56_46698 [Quercus suber]